MKYANIKSYLIENNDFQFFRKSNFIHNLKLVSNYKELAPELQEHLASNAEYLYAEPLDYYNEIELKALVQLQEARRKKIKRLKNRIHKFLIYSSYVYFITFTWRDDILESTNQKTRRTYVQRYLSDTCFIDYYANIDFGSMTQREHYHCVLALQEDILPEWKYGFMYAEKVRSTSKSILRLSTYVNKLTHHAYKDSTKNERCISPKTKYYGTGKVLLPIRESLPFD